MPTIIKTTDELRDVLDQLTTSMDYGLPSFTDTVNSTAANTLMLQIESSLNTLYEKIRLLEDLNTFAYEYIQNEYKKSIDGITQNLKTVQHESDHFLQSKKQSETIAFGSNIYQTTDRNGVPLACADNIREVLLPASEIVQTANAAIVTSSSNAKPYRQVGKPIDAYRSFYCEDAPLSTVIQETVQVLFEQSLTVNYIAIAAFKSSIENLSLINSENNELIPVDLTGNVCVFPPINVKGFVVTLKAGAYDILSLQAVKSESKNAYTDLNTNATELLLDTIYDTLVARVGG